MTALNQQIVEEVQHLTPEQQRKVLMFIRNLQTETGQRSDWIAQAEAFRRVLQAKHGTEFTINVQHLLDDLREES